MQQWLVPSPDPASPAHAVLFRPAGDGPFWLAGVAHASTQNVLRRAQMPQSEYRAPASWLAGGFAELVLERPGHGATGGNYLEDQGGCGKAGYSRSGRATADAIAASAEFMRWQSFVRPEDALIVGHSAGAWGALAPAHQSPHEVSSIIAFAAGRGGRANDFAYQVCAPHTLVMAAGEFGKAARVPVIWLVAANDSCFSPELSKRLADTFCAGGDKVDFYVLPASGNEGHWLIESENGMKIAGPILDRALKRLAASTARKR